MTSPTLADNRLEVERLAAGNMMDRVPDFAYGGDETAELRQSQTR